MFSLFRPKEQWRLVKTFSVDATRISVKGRIYFHLFESDRNSRRIEIASTFLDFQWHILQDHARKCHLYQEKIYRWEMGRVDPDIPRYDQIPEEETVNILKGKIER